MLLSRIPSIVSVCITVALAAPGAAQGQKGVLKGSTYTDEFHGYQVKIPSKWAEVPTQIDENWIVAQFQSNREYEGHHELDNSAFHKPVMRVIMFDEEVIKKTKFTEEAGDTKVTKIKLPYRDYKDYVKRNLDKGGFFFSQEKEAKVNGMSVMQYEVTVDKLTYGGRKQFIAWVYMGQGVSYAVEFEFLMHHFKKHKSFADAPLRSFKIIDRKGSAPETQLVSTSSWTRKDWKKLEAKDRHDKRKAIAEQRIQKAISTLPKGWIVKETKHFVILTHASKKYTTRVETAVECCRQWLEERLGTVTPEYVTRGIVRICKSSDELELYRTGSGDAFSPDDREVVDYEDKDAGTTGGGQGHLFFGLYNQFIYDKDEFLYFHTPAWLNFALKNYFGTAELKGKSLAFKETMYEADSYREMRRKNITPMTPKQIMHATYEVLEKGEKKGEYSVAQILHYIRFLEGPGKKHKLLKDRDFILEYMKETLVQAEDYIDKNPREARATATTEAEEETQSRKSSKFDSTRRTKICENVNKSVCKWSEADWKDLEEAFVKFNK